MTTQRERDLDRNAKLTTDIYMTSHIIAVLALVFQIPYLMTACVWFFWVLCIFGGLIALVFYTRINDAAVAVVKEGGANRYMEDYDNRYKDIVFQASWVISLLAWYLFYLRGHVWLPVLLAVGSVIFEVAKRKLRKRLPVIMADNFVWQAQKLFTGEGEDDDYRT